MSDQKAVTRSVYELLVEAKRQRNEAREALATLLEWAERFRAGDTSLSSEEFYIARDFARVVLGSGDTPE